VTVYGPERERLYANRVALTYYGMTLDDWRGYRWDRMLIPRI